MMMVMMMMIIIIIIIIILNIRTDVRTRSLLGIRKER